MQQVPCRPTASRGTTPAETRPCATSGLSSSIRIQLTTLHAPLSVLVTAAAVTVAGVTVSAVTATVDKTAALFEENQCSQRSGTVLIHARVEVHKYCEYKQYALAKYSTLAISLCLCTTSVSNFVQWLSITLMMTSKPLKLSRARTGIKHSTSQNCFAARTATNMPVQTLFSKEDTLHAVVHLYTAIALDAE
eukprot:17130-Heterococcus_DN1.PRE.1